MKKAWIIFISLWLISFLALCNDSTNIDRYRAFQAELFSGRLDSAQTFSKFHYLKTKFFADRDTHSLIGAFNILCSGSGNLIPIDRKIEMLDSAKEWAVQSNNEERFHLVMYSLVVNYIQTGMMNKALEIIISEMGTLENTANDYLRGLYQRHAQQLTYMHFQNQEYEKAMQLAIEMHHRFQNDSAIMPFDRCNHLKTVCAAAIELKHADTRYWIDTALSYTKINGCNNATLYANLAAYFIETNQLDSAELLMLQSFEQFKANDDYMQIGPSAVNLGVLYNQKKEFKKALTFANIGLSYSKKYNQISHILDAHLAKRIAFKELKQYDSLSFSLENYLEVKQRYQNEELQKERQRLEVVYALNKKNAELASLQTEATLKDEIIDAKSKQSILAFGAIILLGLLGAIIARIALKNKHLLNQLQSKHSELELLSKRQQEVLSVLSHDLRTPMANFQMLMETKSLNLLSKDEENTLNQELTSQFKSASFTIENILNWTTKYLKGELINEPFMLQMAVNRVIEEMSSTAAKKEVKLISTVNQEKVLANLDLTIIILRNVISNAIKFSPIQSEVLIELKETPEHYALHISDAGQGMSAEALSKINKQEAAKSNVGTAGETGMGLGLKLSQDFAIRMDAKLYVHQSNSAGTTMLLALKKAN